MNPYAGAYRRNQVVNRRIQRRTAFSGALVAFFLLFLASCVLVGKRTVGQQLLIEVQNLKSEHKRLITEQSIYISRKQEYLSRERIIAFARERLGLDFPEPGQVRWVRLESTAAGTGAKDMARQ
ncbi:hypothetical protein LLH00_04350 [bacterium]|nr:hypothetical protein [bacterium]